MTRASPCSRQCAQIVHQIPLATHLGTYTLCEVLRALTYSGRWRYIAVACNQPVRCCRIHVIACERTALLSLAATHGSCLSHIQVTAAYSDSRSFPFHPYTCPKIGRAFCVVTSDSCSWNTPLRNVAFAEIVSGVIAPQIANGGN